MGNIDKKYALIVIVLLTICIQVICQSTLGNVKKTKCEDSSPDFRLLLNKLQMIDDKINLMETKGKNCSLNYFYNI